MGAIRRRRRRARVIAITVALAMVVGVATLALSAGGDDGGPTTARGGAITIAYGAQPDYLDPALAYSLEGWEALPQVYTSLLTYRHAEGKAGTELIPGLAEALPRISDGGRTYRLKLRDGLRYSDGRPVKASDFEHTIRRVLNLESGGAPFYEIIRGAEAYLKAGDAKADITGIETDDRSGAITIRLDEADASFSNVLAMPFAGLVPGDTAFRSLTREPPPGVGPYTIAESIPNRRFVLERNPRFAALKIPDLPVGHVDEITVRIVKSAQKATQDVLGNELDYMRSSVPADLKPTVRERAGDRYFEHTVASTLYLYMHTGEPPFDDPRVRQAVAFAVDRPALARLYAGDLQPGCAFLPPGMPGYDEALDTRTCPYGDPTKPPDLARARELLKEAGAQGANVTVWGSSAEPESKVAQAYADMLNKLGLDAKPKLLDESVQFQTIGNARTRAQTGADSWFEDFPHPLNFFYLVDGDAILERNNQNLSHVDDRRINESIDRLRLETDLDAVAGEWAALDEHLISPPQSYVVPFGHQKLTAFFSERMDAERAMFHPILLNDYTSFALKPSA